MFSSFPFDEMMRTMRRSYAAYEVERARLHGSRYVADVRDRHVFGRVLLSSEDAESTVEHGPFPFGSGVTTREREAVDGEFPFFFVRAKLVPYHSRTSFVVIFHDARDRRDFERKSTPRRDSSDELWEFWPCTMLQAHALAGVRVIESARDDLLHDRGCVWM